MTGNVLYKRGTWNPAWKMPLFWCSQLSTILIKGKKKKRKDSILFNVFCNTLAYKISSEVAQRLPT